MLKHCIRNFVLLVLVVAMPRYYDTVAAQSEDAVSLIARSVEVNRRDWDHVDEYDYFQREPKGSGSRTYEVMMLSGSRYWRLVAIDDKPLSEEQVSWEQKRLDEELARRRRETAEQQQKRIAEHRKEAERNHLLLQEMAKAFEFRAAQSETIDGREALVFDGWPKTGYRAPNNQAKALTGMRGRLWIDAETLHWVRVDAEVFRPIWIQSFAQVRPGTRFHFEQAETSSGLWMPSRFSVEVRAKVFFVFSHSEHQDFTYFGYHRNADSARDKSAVEHGRN